MAFFFPLKIVIIDNVLQITATPKMEKLHEVVVLIASPLHLLGEGRIPTPGLWKRTSNTHQHWTHEINSSLLVNILTAQGRKTPHTTQGHAGAALRNRVNKQGL